MKIRPLLPIVILAVASYFCAAGSTALAQDPVVVNSSTVKLKFENDHVRVLEATLPAGAKEQMHSHPACIIYAVEGGRFRNYTPDGKTTEGELKTGEVTYREPLTHAAENIGDKPAHLILVELKSKTGG
jgi:quercetin dioxygenase-like cupin family protein